MTDRIPCLECKALILPTTAVKNDGLCMPCKGGYRKSIEESKVRAEQEKQYRETPPSKHWSWLVDQVHKTDAGFDGLSHANKLYFSASLVNGEVHNGGFDQYFYNSSGSHFNFAVEAMRTIGARESLDLLLSAKHIVFGDAEVPVDTGDRRRIMFAIDEAAKDIREKELDTLDRAFWKSAGTFVDLLEEFAEKHDLRKGF